LKGGEVAVVRGKDGRFQVTIPKDLTLALGLEGREKREIPAPAPFLYPSGPLFRDHREGEESWGG